MDTISEFLPCVLILGLWVGIPILIGWARGKISSNASPVSPSKSLALRCRRASHIIKDGSPPVEIIQVEIKDLIIPYDGKSHSLRLTLYDMCGNQRHPVHCAIEDLRAPGSLNFQIVDALPAIPLGKILDIDDYTKFSTIPIEVLIFPWSGKRIVEAKLEVLSGNSITQFTTATIEVESTFDGYFESRAKQDRAEELGFYLALHLAAADGHLDPREAAIVKDWAKLQLENVSENSREKRKQRLNVVVSDAFTIIENHDIGLELNGIAKELNDQATTPMKYEIMELCMDVMKADGVADPSEIRELKRIAELMGLDKNRYQSLLDQRLAEVKTFPVDSAENLADLLGISPDMPKEEIRRHLNKEFRKWNARVSHDDKEIRQRAEEKLELLAQARREYL